MIHFCEFSLYYHRCHTFQSFCLEVGVLWLSKISFPLLTVWQIASSVFRGSNTKMVIRLTRPQVVTLLTYIFAISIKKKPPSARVSGLSKIYMIILVSCILHFFMFIEVFKICMSSLL